MHNEKLDKTNITALCICCEKTKDECMNFNVGYICKGCFLDLVNSRQKREEFGKKIRFEGSIIKKPSLDITCYAVKGLKDELITIDKKLYTFITRKGALSYMSDLEKENPNEEFHVGEISSMEVFYYCLHNKLNLVAFDAWKSKK